jgi:uncharacterized membrane protein
MSELIVAVYDDTHTAFLARAALARLQKELLIKGHDVALVSREKTGKVTVGEAIELKPTKSTHKTFWNTLVFLLFSSVWGENVNKDAKKKIYAIGIDEPFTAKLKNTIKPNTSAIFLLINESVRDKVIGLLQGFDGKITRTCLTGKNSEELLDLLSGEKSADSRSAQEFS